MVYVGFRGLGFRSLAFLVVSKIGDPFSQPPPNKMTRVLKSTALIETPMGLGCMKNKYLEYEQKMNEASLPLSTSWGGWRPT